MKICFGAYNAWEPEREVFRMRTGILPPPLLPAPRPRRYPYLSYLLDVVFQSRIVSDGKAVGQLKSDPYGFL